METHYVLQATFQPELRLDRIRGSGLDCGTRRTHSFRNEPQVSVAIYTKPEANRNFQISRPQLRLQATLNGEG
jgi:hypothetical protein